MAIVVEEERSRVNIVSLAGWVVVIGVVAVAAYFLFFAAPQLVAITPPADYQDISPAVGFTLQPQDVLNSAAFQALTPPSFPLPTPQGPASVGRTNPFIAP